MGLTNEHVGPKILAKIEIYVLTRAELLITLCYEIPCTFEMLRVAYNRPVGKINFSLVFCPSVIRGPLSNPTNNHTSVKQCFDLNKNNLYP